MEVRPLGRCCDCRWLGVTGLGVLCEASLPDWAAEVINKYADTTDLSALDILKVRRCDCFERKEDCNG